MSEVYRATIGLEVHAELATKSKMFCGCKNDPHDIQPNTHVCPICLAHPGTLPAPNEEAISLVLLFGQAVNATRAKYSEFDRKNYFYPDIPKAYQISQYAFPFLSGGELSGVALTRVHLEEDTARSSHEMDDHSLVDFNRAGVPLMELVTEPVIHDSKTAGQFARELQLLLRTLKISNAQMERGEMRVEANISISDNDKLGTKVEVKNLNSFKSVESAIEYELSRQADILRQGGVVTQETRGWDEVKQKTFSQRSKETAKDYRYFPDPDIPKIDASKHEYFSTSRLNDILPKLPSEKRLEYTNLGLPIQQVEIIIADKYFDEFFSKIVDSAKLKQNGLKLAANYLTSDIQALRLEEAESYLTLESFLSLMTLLEGKKITSRVAKDLLVELWSKGGDPAIIANERGLIRDTDSNSINKVVVQVIELNPDVVADYKAGKDSALQFLIGQGMKLSRGSADPALLAESLRKHIIE